MKVKILKILFIFVLATFSPFPYPSQQETLSPETNIQKTPKPVSNHRMIPIKDLIYHSEDYFDFETVLAKGNLSFDQAKSNFQSLIYLLFSNWSIESNALKVEIDKMTGRIKRIANPLFRATLREKLFSGLYQILDQLEPQMRTLKYNRQGQQKFAQKANQPIDSWVQANLTRLEQLLPLVVELPEDNAGYARNEALDKNSFRNNSRAYYSIYCHAWPVNGETDFHNHGGAMAFTAAVTPGFIETTLNTDLKDEISIKKSWENKVYTFKSTDKKLIPGHIGILTRGIDSNHKIRNVADHIAIMIEIYVWPGPYKGIKRVNNSIPVFAEEDQFLVLNVPVSGMPYKISDRLQNLEGTIIDENVFLNELDELFSENEKTIYSGDVLGIFTNENRALISAAQVKAYIQQHAPTIIEYSFKDEEKKLSAYLLIPTSRSAQAATPSLDIAKSI